MTTTAAAVHADEVGSLADVVEATRRALPTRWHEQRCLACRRTFFSPVATDICMAASCDTWRLRLRPRACPIPAEALWRAVRGHVTALGFTAAAFPDEIVSHTGETLFISAALQILDPVVHCGAPVPLAPLVAAQPVIRLNSTPDVGGREGFSTAFVNLGTEEVVDSVAAYGRHLLAWIGALRALGLDESRLVLIAEPVRFHGGLHEGSYLVLDYGGVEIGEGVFIDTVRTHRGLQVVDFGFGLERLLWAVNGTPTYYDNLGPFPARLQGCREAVDAARTAVLMALAGIEPGHRSRGYRMRVTVRRLGDALQGTDATALLRHAHREWSVFIRPSVSEQGCIAVIGSELDRGANLLLCRRLGIRPPDGALLMDQDAFCALLLRRGVTFSAMLHAARTNRQTPAVGPP